MASITSAGIGSGLDVNGLVQQLVAAERAPVENRLNRREALYQAELSAYGTVKSVLSSFQTTMANLASVAEFNKLKTTSSDTTILEASASSSAATGTYSVEISTLAKAQTLASDAFADTTTEIGTGTLTFQFGTYDSGTFTANADKAVQTVDIGATDGSLSGIRDAVNNADIGVTASIINDGSGYRLVFNSEDSGADNSLKITVSDSTDSSDTDDAGLSQLAYDPTATAGTGKNLTETVTAQDASFSVNGIDITQSTNTVTGVIEGVTLNLKDVTSGSPVTVKVAQDTGAITKSVESFVSSYNGLKTTLKGLSSYNAETGQGAILQGDSIIRSISSQISTILTSAVSGLSGSYRSLADIGITTQSDGTLALNSSKLQDAISDDSSIIGKLFAAAGTPDDALVDFVSATDDTQVGEYAVNITQLATRGSYTGAADSGFPLTINADNNTFVIKVDGTQSATIALTQQSYTTGAELAAEIQSQINGDSNLQDIGASVTVTYDTDHFEITSDAYGSDSSVEIVSVDTTTAATIGLSAGAGTDGVDVAGTIGGVAATGTGQTLEGAGDAAGLKITITGGTTGDRGNIVFSRGIADQLNTVLEGYVGSDSLLDARTDGLNNRIDDINEQRERLDRRIAAIEARYIQQFTALDTLLGQLQSTSNYLAQQLAALPGAKTTAG